MACIASEGIAVDISFTFLFDTQHPFAVFRLAADTLQPVFQAVAGALLINDRVVQGKGNIAEFREIIHRADQLAVPDRAQLQAFGLDLFRVGKNTLRVIRVKAVGIVLPGFLTARRVIGNQVLVLGCLCRYIAVQHDDSPADALDPPEPFFIKLMPDRDHPFFLRVNAVKRNFFTIFIAHFQGYVRRGGIDPHRPDQALEGMAEGNCHKPQS